MENNHKKNWEKFRDEELAKVTLLLGDFGFVLEDKQVHIGGERYLTGGRKLVLIARRKQDNKKVIIKISNDPLMILEIDKERESRTIVDKIDFAYHVFSFPDEILYTKKQDYTILITEFIEQEISFLERPLQEQFFIALKAFESQEAIHATTHEHANKISQTFGIWTAKDYLEKLENNIQEINKISDNQDLKVLLEESLEFFANHLPIVDLYSNFLTHWDFVPHNFRIKGNEMYLLDHSSIRFGNKYESWARFINFMTLHNDPLEEVLLKYVKDNRNPAEHQALHLMRIFRLIELIWYYQSTLENTSGNHKTLNKKRIDLWTNVLRAVLKNSKIERNFIEEYKKLRDSLRSDEERQRQQGLH